MPLPRNHDDATDLPGRLRDAKAVTSELLSSVIASACRRFPSIGQPERTTQIERLMASEAWTDAVLALFGMELPQWKVRRITYDEGEWYCALSRERELPDWLDQSIEAHRFALSNWRCWQFETAMTFPTHYHDLSRKADLTPDTGKRHARSRDADPFQAGVTIRPGTATLAGIIALKAAFQLLIETV